MANVKELRGRIKSVSGIQKITGAMEMVASMKLRKVQARALALRPYANEIKHLIDHLAAGVGSASEVPLFDRRPAPRNAAVLVISSDRGLCGAYNTNLLARFHQLEDRLKARGVDIKLYCYGKKGYSYLYRRKYHIERFFVDPPLDKADFAAAKMVSNELVAAFQSGAVDEVYVVHTQFVSVARFLPSDLLFLPVGDIAVGDEAARDASAARRGKHDYILEPDAKTVFNRLIPRYLETVIFDAMIGALASEQASRRMAMKGATDAAKRMTRDLKRIYNRARQESITKELLDIIGGANAVS